MNRRFAASVGLTVLLLVCAAFFARPTSVVAQVPQSQLFPTDFCTAPLKYSPGAMLQVGTDYYRCLYVFGDNMKPAGVGWIKIVKQDTFVPKEPSAGR